MIRRFVFALAVCAFASGCPAALDDPAAFESVEGGSSAAAATCPDIPTQIFATSCAQSGCHASAAPAASLDLQSPGVAARLVGVKPALCASSAALVDPSNPDQSLLYEKLGPSPPCGARMPLTGHYLSDSDTSCVRSWIANLSRADGGASSEAAQEAGDAPAQ